MKIITICCLLVSVLLALTSCSTTATTRTARPTDSTPETVIVRYQVKPGKEADLQALLARAWQIYRREHMVLARPHIIAAERSASYQVQVTEIFTWVSHSAPEHAPADVVQIWAEMQTLCEPRNGQSGVGGGEGELIQSE